MNAWFQSFHKTKHRLFDDADLWEIPEVRQSKKLKNFEGKKCLKYQKQKLKILIT
jgi:hypothetical protein